MPRARPFPIALALIGCLAVGLLLMGAAWVDEPGDRPVRSVMVGGEVFRCPANQPCPPSAPVTVTIPPTTAPPPALCHADHPNAVAISEAIRYHFPEGWWTTFCRIAWCESTFDPGAYNRSGATGLFQIMPMWHDELDVDPWTIWGSAALARHVFDVQGANAWSCY